MHTLRQIAAVTALNVRNLPQRVASSVVALVGVAAVVLVFAAVLSMAKGFERTMISAGSEETAIVMRSAATSELNSGLSNEEMLVVASAPGVLKNGDTPVVSSELYVVVDLRKKSNNEDANVPLRGVQASAFDVRDNVRIAEGRMFEPGKNELIAGALNSMYSSISARGKEIATLRALGFGPLSVLVSTVIESLLLAAAGGVLGGLIAYLVFNGFQVSTLYGASFGQVVFDFAVTGDLLLQGLLAALLIGFVGGLFPAVRAARMPVAQALRVL